MYDISKSIDRTRMHLRFNLIAPTAPARRRRRRRRLLLVFVSRFVSLILGLLCAQVFSGPNYNPVPTTVIGEKLMLVAGQSISI